MSYPEVGRRCTVCGRGQTPRLGGLGGYRALIEAFKSCGSKLKLPDSTYLHPRCAEKEALRLRGAKL